MAIDSEYNLNDSFIENDGDVSDYNNCITVDNDSSSKDSDSLDSSNFSINTLQNDNLSKDGDSLNYNDITTNILQDNELYSDNELSDFNNINLGNLIFIIFVLKLFILLI